VNILHKVSLQEKLAIWSPILTNIHSVQNKFWIKDFSLNIDMF